MIHMIQNLYIEHKLIINILISLTGIGMYLYNLIAYKDANLKSMGFELLIMTLIPYLNVAFLLLNGMALYINIISKNNIVMQKGIKELEELENFLKLTTKHLKL